MFQVVFQRKLYVHFHTDPTDFAFPFLECRNTTITKTNYKIYFYMNQAVYRLSPKEGTQQKK